MVLVCIYLKGIYYIDFVVYENISQKNILKILD